MDRQKMAHRRRSLRRIVIVTSLMVGCTQLRVTPAVAQVEGLGFKVGNKSRLHTNLDISASFDSNSNRASDRPETAANELDGVEDVRLLVRPSISLEVPGQSVRFQFGLGTTISQYMGAGGARPADTEFGLDGKISLRLGSKQSTFAFVFENAPILTPTVLPELGTIGADERLFSAFSDMGRLYFTLRPGGGALEFDVGYKNQFVIYTRSNDGDELANGSPDDTFLHTGFLEARLRFLPKTAALLYAEFGALDAFNPDDGRRVTTLESNPFNVALGLKGQVTRSISAELRVGYGETLVWDNMSGRFGQTSPANQRTVIGLASATWQTTRTSQLSLAYQRNVQPTVALSSFISDALRFRSTWNIDRLILGAYIEGQLRDFGAQEDAESVVPGETPNREPSAVLVLGGLRADYYFLTWLYGSLNYRVIIQMSNDEDRSLALPQLGDFERHQVFATAGIRY